MAEIEGNFDLNTTNLEASFDLTNPHYEVTFDIQQPQIEATLELSQVQMEAEFDLDQQDINAVFELNVAGSGAQKLTELEDVSISSPTQGQTLTYDTSLQKWKNTAHSSVVGWGGITGNIEDQTDLQEELDAKQDELISGTSIKTINNISLLGSGNIEVQSATFTYEQGVASATWVITHNLNKFPSVSVTDSAGSTIECSVTYNDTNTCTLKMNGEFKGKAYLN